MIKSLPQLIRFEQWYKNLLIFLPFLFLDNKEIYPWSLWIIGFFGFCAVSSMTYIINDWVDRKEDRLHPTKKNRPLASGKISGKQAIGIGILLAGIVGLATWQLGSFYSFIVGTYFVLTNAYSFGLKHIPILDLTLIAVNFTLRTLAGTPFWPPARTFPYFILVFSLIFIFLTHKRRSDIKLLGKKAVEHKPVLKFYTPFRAYFIRLIGYAGTLLGLYALWIHGTPIIHLIPAFGLLIITSLLLSKQPELAIKPHHLIQHWTWDVAMGLTIFSFFL